MRDLTYYVAVSIDGRIAAPDGSWDAFLTEGDHFDVIFGEYRDALPAPALSGLGLTADTSLFDTVLMGWNTYAVGLPVGLVDPYPHLRQYVFSREHGIADAENPVAGIGGEVAEPAVTITSEDPIAVVRRLKAEQTGTGIWLCGGGQLASALVDEIDRLVLKVNPVVLGDGIPLFAGDSSAPRAFRLTASRTFDSGVVIAEYERA